MIRKLLILFTCFFSTFDIDNVSAQEDIDPKENAAKQVDKKQNVDVAMPALAAKA